MLIAILTTLTVGCLLVLYFILRTARREDGCFGCRLYDPQHSFCRHRLIHVNHDDDCEYNEPEPLDTIEGAGDDRQDIRDADGAGLLPLHRR